MKFDMLKEDNSIIKVIGVGGGGGNAINHMYRQGIKGVDFIICNTDAQALELSPIPNKIQLGATLTEGRGAGSIPEIGRHSAIENMDQIKALLANTKMVFITAGMGGGTGTGASPIIAQAAKELGILTVGIVTTPFSFEGKRRRSQADEGLEELRNQVDTLLVVSNDKLREMYGNLTLSNAFAEADSILTTAAKGIAEIITVPGYINVDFEDVKTVMKNSGAAVMGSCTAGGEERARKAVEGALSSPLLNDNEIEGARYILLNISSGRNEVLMDEVSVITDYIQEEAGLSADIIWGNCYDDTMEDEISVTIIATGFQTKKEKETTRIKHPERIVTMLNDPDLLSEFDLPKRYSAPKAESNWGEPVSSGLDPTSRIESPRIESSRTEPSSRIESTRTGATSRIESPRAGATSRIESPRTGATSRIESPRTEPSSRIESPPTGASPKMTVSEGVRKDSPAQDRAHGSPVEPSTWASPTQDMFTSTPYTWNFEPHLKSSVPTDSIQGEKSSGTPLVSNTSTAFSASSDAAFTAPSTAPTAAPFTVPSIAQSSMDAEHQSPKPYMWDPLAVPQEIRDRLFFQLPQSSTPVATPTNIQLNHEPDSRAGVAPLPDSPAGPTAEDQQPEIRVTAKPLPVSPVERDAEEQLPEIRITSKPLPVESRPVSGPLGPPKQVNLFELPYSFESTPNRQNTLRDPMAQPLKSEPAGDDDPMRRTKERILRLKELSMKLKSPRGLEELENEPAYVRKKLKMDQVPHSSTEEELSRLTLSDRDGVTEIRSNNTFLHDNVD